MNDLTQLSAKDVERYWTKVSPTGFCWTWTGSVNEKFYGNFSANRTTYRAHRISYELLVAPIPAGLVLDHLCRNPSCVNPDHLEPVTVRENTIRGRAPQLLRELRTKQECKRGHPLPDPPPGSTRRFCRPCHRIAQQKYRDTSPDYAERHRLNQARYLERKANG